jgi:hypothetical protein
MLRTILSVVLVLAVMAGSLWAAVTKTEAVVVSYDKGKLVVKVGDKEKTVMLRNTTHVHDVDGSEVSVKDRTTKLKKDVKIEIVEEDGKLDEINIKK